MSQETPRSSAGFTTPRTFEEFVQNEDDFPDFSSSSDESSNSDCEEKTEEQTHNWQMVSASISECNDCEKYKKETQRRISILEAKFSEESMAKHRQMQLMVEYEKKIREWFAEKNALIRELKLEKQDAELERKKSTEKLKMIPTHFLNLQKSYENLLRKYERAKNTVKFLGANIETLLHQYQDCINQTQSRFDQLKRHTVKKFNQVNQELDFTVKKITSENTKLRRKSEAKVLELTRLLEQKNQENLELTYMCDFLLRHYEEAFKS